MRALERDRDARYPTAGEIADDLEKVMFEMRISPHEPRKLLVSLFPQGPSRTGELRLPVTPSPILLQSSSSSLPGVGSLPSGGSLRQSGGSAVPSPIAANLSASNPTKPLADPVHDLEMADLAPSVRTQPRRRAGRRGWLMLGGVLGIVFAVVAITHPPWGPGPKDEPAVTPATAQPVAEPKREPTPTPPAPKTTVEISLDSNPQDAQVIREDTGQVVGRTPLTISLAQARDVISFRFEKAGHAAISYKVIPDLDKSVRAELALEPVEDSKRTPPLRHAPPPRGKGGPVAHQTSKAGGSEAAVAVPDQPRSCLMSVGSFPWTELWIDGKDTGQRTPVVHYPVSCGSHRLNLKRRDLRLDRVEQVMVAPDHELKQHYELGDEYGGE
jgi:hypothetical protein